MIVKKIKCPNCGGVIEIKNVNDEKILLITCPNTACNAKIRLTFDTGETVLAMPKSRETVGVIRCQRVNYSLNIGKTTIGRKTSSPQSPVDMAIPTDDKTMSRVHAEIEVLKLKNGRIKVVLSDIRDQEKSKKKPILLEDEPLSNIDRVVLCNGDRFTLGNTSFQYIQE